MGSASSRRSVGTGLSTEPMPTKRQGTATQMLRYLRRVDDVTASLFVSPRHLGTEEHRARHPASLLKGFAGSACRSSRVLRGAAKSAPSRSQARSVFLSVPKIAKSVSSRSRKQSSAETPSCCQATSFPIPSMRKSCVKSPPFNNVLLPSVPVRRRSGTTTIASGRGAAHHLDGSVTPSTSPPTAA
jgi:hypothetical protein